MAGERVGHSLQATALVNEAFIRLVDGKAVEWHDRAHFLAVSARMMRRILVDHARTKHYQKRGGHAAKVSFDEALAVTTEPGPDFIALDDALEALSKFDERKSRVIEMRFFGGSRVAIIVSQPGKRRLAVMSADGTNSRILASSIEIHGVVGQGAADWSPDGSSIVAAGSDDTSPGLFKIPVDGGAPVRLVEGWAYNPVYSPNGDAIIYASGFGGAGGRSVLRRIRPDGTPVSMREVEVRVGGAHRFLPSGLGVVYLPSVESKDFWLLDVATNSSRQLTHLSDRGFLNTFDVTLDGKYLVFDRTRQNSDIVLIDLPRK